MTKHIPTDIDNMSQKGLAELCKIQFDENQTLLEQIEQLQCERDEMKAKLIRYEREAIEIAKAQELFALEQKIDALHFLSQW